MTAGQPRLFAAGQSATTSDDYYTPKWVFDALGLTFDLDVAAPPGGAPFVPADTYYTVEDDGLLQPWHGRVWMNPPFSKTEPWGDKFIAHRHGVALVPTSNGRWYTRLWAAADGFTIGPEQFEFVNGSGHGIPRRICLAAFGDECVAALRNIGPVRVPESP
jgi:hypothetical protein